MAEGDYIIYAGGRFYAAQIGDTDYQVAVDAYPYGYVVTYLGPPLGFVGGRARSRSPWKLHRARRCPIGAFRLDIIAHGPISA